MKISTEEGKNKKGKRRGAEPLIWGPKTKKNPPIKKYLNLALRPHLNAQISTTNQKVGFSPLSEE